MVPALAKGMDNHSPVAKSTNAMPLICVILILGSFIGFLLLVEFPWRYG